MPALLVRCRINGCGLWVVASHASLHAWEVHHRAVKSAQLGPPDFSWEEASEPPKFSPPGTYPVPARRRA